MQRSWFVMVAVSLLACEGRIAARGGAPMTMVHPPVQPEPTLEGTPAQGSYAQRLRHAQWESAVKALTGLSSPLGVTLLDDNLSDAHFDTSQAHRSVSSALLAQYRQAAEQLASRAVDDPAVFAALTAGVDRARPIAEQRATVTRRLLERAFRRAATAEEQASYERLFDRAPGVTAADAGSALREGVRTLLEALMQSAHFLYRVERGDAAQRVALGEVEERPLTRDEYLTKLSFALWDAPPDEALRQRGTDESLRSDEGRRSLVRAMLRDPRASATVLRFHRQLFNVDQFRGIQKDRERYADAAELGRDAEVESTRFLEWVEGSGFGVRALLTSRVSFVNRRLAQRYAMDTTGFDDDTFRQVELDERRPGILTRVGWNAFEADTVERRSIHRGVFVLREVLCEPLGTPNQTAFAEAQMRVPPAEAVTNRAIVAYRTEWGGCAACHSTRINPVGFAFEHYDAVGRWVERDRDQPVNAAGELYLSGALVRFSDAAALLRQVAESPSAHRCYARNAFEFVSGFAAGRDERAELDAIGERSLREDLPLRAVFEEVLTSKSFRVVRVRREGAGQ